MRHVKRVRGLTLTQEMIHFQKDHVDIVEEITRRVDAVREYAVGRTNNPDKVYDSTAAKELLAYFEERMGLKFKYGQDDYNAGPAILLPAIDENHIFNSPDEIILANQYNYDLERTSKIIFKALDKPFYEGIVDLENCKFGKAFSSIRLLMYIPINEFSEKAIFTSRELAEVILHEVGHIGTSFIMLANFVRANQVINLIANAGKRPDKLEFVISKSAKAINLDEKERQVIRESKGSVSIITKVVLDRFRERLSEEIGGDAYSSVSCEQLADQFAVRCGAGTGLVSALEKLAAVYGTGWRFWAINALAILGFMYLVACTLGLWLIIMIACADRGDAIYDDDRTRYARIRHQLIEKLKTTKLTNTEQARLISDIDAIEESIKKASTGDSMLTRFFAICKSSYRKQRNVEMLQKDLEVIASNDIFVEAARFNTLLEVSDK